MRKVTQLLVSSALDIDFVALLDDGSLWQLRGEDGVWEQLDFDGYSEPPIINLSCPQPENAPAADNPRLNSTLERSFEVENTYLRTRLRLKNEELGQLRLRNKELGQTIQQLNTKLHTRACMALKIYEAARWVSINPASLTRDQDKALWTEFRDVMGIPAGTATKKDVGALPSGVF